VSPDDAEPTAAPPLLQVVSGDPTPDELAALVAVVTARRGPANAARRDAPRLRSRWGDPASRHRQPLRIGPGRWRASAR